LAGEKITDLRLPSKVMKNKRKRYAPGKTGAVAFTLPFPYHKLFFDLLH
jgi:hypothetical protein